jgi:hypothetical protein
MMRKRVQKNECGINEGAVMGRDDQPAWLGRAVDNDEDRGLGGVSMGCAASLRAKSAHGGAFDRFLPGNYGCFHPALDAACGVAACGGGSANWAFGRL